MPPINQQGSRAGLVTALVVFAILFITSSIFAFQFYGKNQQTTADYAAYKTRYNGIVQETALSSASVEALKSSRTEQPRRFGVTDTDSVLDVSLHQTNGLAAMIRGGAVGEAAAYPAFEEATSTLTKSQQSLKAAGITDVLVPSTGLDGAINTLTSALVASRASITSLNTDLADRNSKIKAKDEDFDKEVKRSKDELDSVTKKSTDDVAHANQATADLKASIDKMGTDFAAGGAQIQLTTTQKDTEIGALNKQLADNQKTINQLKARLSAHRPTVESAAIHQSDGKLIRVSSNGACYINLGKNDQVTAGLTFEVYDKAEGVPSLPENGSADEQMPVGKGSIEITHVGSTSSECRVIKTTPGAVLSEGDLIANLVYDPNTKYNFFVYGDFDLSETGRPNAPDSEVIKRLITQWGAKVGDSVSPATDFVVLGSEPVVPTFGKDDLTAENAKKVANAQDALAKFQEIEANAKDLHIPILNQNRFLYYVGFYDQAKR